MESGIDATYAGSPKLGSKAVDLRPMTTNKPKEIPEGVYKKKRGYQSLQIAADWRDRSSGDESE